MTRRCFTNGERSAAPIARCEAADPAALVLAADDDEAPGVGEQPPHQPHRSVAGDVEHDVVALAERLERGRGVVDDVLGTEGAHQVGLRRAADAR